MKNTKVTNRDGLLLGKLLGLRCVRPPKICLYEDISAGSYHSIVLDYIPTSFHIMVRVLHRVVSEGKIRKFVQRCPAEK